GQVVPGEHNERERPPANRMGALPGIADGEQLGDDREHEALGHESRRDGNYGDHAIASSRRWNAAPTVCTGIPGGTWLIARSDVAITYTWCPSSASLAMTPANGSGSSDATTTSVDPAGS